MSEEELVRRLRDMLHELATPVDVGELHPEGRPLWPEEKDSVWDEALVAEAADAIETLRRERDEAREALEWAKEATQPIASLVAMTAEGFPDHDICPIRLGQARAIAEAHAAIDAALKEDGE